jgi:hypothetical protein
MGLNVCYVTEMGRARVNTHQQDDIGELTTPGYICQNLRCPIMIFS